MGCSVGRRRVFVAEATLRFVRGRRLDRHVLAAGLGGLLLRRFRAQFGERFLERLKKVEDGRARAVRVRLIAPSDVVGALRCGQGTRTVPCS